MRIEVITQSAIGNTRWRCIGDVLNAVSVRPDCQRFRFAVAYMRLSGLKLLYGTLHALYARSGHISGAVGIDQGITTIEALELLRQISSDSTMVCTVSNYIYHPKLYLVEGDTWACTIVGSANLTRDGLYRNVELATIIHLDLATSTDVEIYTSFDTFLSELLNPTNPNVQPLNATTLDQLAEMAIISDEARVREPRSTIRRRAVPASFTALFPPLPVFPIPTVGHVVSVSANREHTPALAFGQSSQQLSKAQLNPSADALPLELSTPPLPIERPEEGPPEPLENTRADALPLVEQNNLAVEPERHIRQRLHKTSCEVCNNIAKCTTIVDKSSESLVGRIHFLCKECNKNYFYGMNDSEKLSLIEKANKTSRRTKLPLSIALNVVLGRDTLSTARAKVRARSRRENEQSKKRARSQRWRPIYGPRWSG